MILCFEEHSHLETCASNIRALNKLYYSTRYFCYNFQSKIAIEPGAFHYSCTKCIWTQIVLWSKVNK